MKRIAGLVAALIVLWARVGAAVPVSLQVGAGDTGRLFGGTDAEGGIGDWYASNGVIDVTTSPNVKPAPTDFQSTGGIDRFSATLTRAIAQDTYFIVEAGAKLPASVNTLPPPPIVDIVEPGVVPVAFTNPIFVDEDGNATFDPPGLPVMMASNAGGEEPGFWAHLRRGLAQLAARLAGAVVAEGPPGEMTGVTKEEKAEAMRKGEYFPLREFTIPAGAVEAARQAEEAASRGGGPAGTREPPAGK
jgi:hypothetical protein